LKPVTVLQPYFFVSLSARLRENGWTDLYDIFRESVERPWDNLITFFGQFRETMRCCNAQHGGGVCAFAPQLVIWWKTVFVL